MAATYTNAIRYWVDAKCQTPLRSGGTEGDPETVLRYPSGQAFLQGASLAGAMRCWIERQTDGEKMAARLFGSQEKSGTLTVSDGVFDAAANQAVRPRLRIETSLGSAADGGKFDVAHVEEGSMFAFQIVWMGTAAEMGEIETVENMLSALHGGEILLGAQRTNGFGRVSLSVKKQEYDLLSEKGREEWLADIQNGKPLLLNDAKETRWVTFLLSGKADSLLVKDRVVEFKNEKPYQGNIRENGIPVIPGSSVKGAVRARVKAISKLMHVDEDLEEELFGRMDRGNDNGKPGRTRFEDVKLSGDGNRITRIRIDRFTGGVIRGGLFSEEPICGRLQAKISVSEENPAACGLLLFALRDLGLGLYNLGSGGSIGRGFISVDTIEVRNATGKKALLRFGDGKLLSMEDEGFVQDWLLKLKEERNGN